MTVKMKEPTMLFKHPGSSYMHDDHYDYIIVDACDKEKHLKEGWSQSLIEAKAKSAPVAEEEESEDDSPPTRAELEAMADKLGIKYDGRTTDAKLAARIDSALKEG